MRLSILRPHSKTLTLNVEPTISIKDLMRKIYMTSPELHAHTSFMQYEKTISLYLLTKKLKFDKILLDYPIYKSNLISVIPHNRKYSTNQKIQPKFPDIPEELCCPLTMEIFLCPVLLPCNITVELAMISTWIVDHGTCPFTRNPLTLDDLRPNKVIENKVINFFDQYKHTRFINALRKKQYVIPNYTQDPDDEVSATPPTTAPRALQAHGIFQMRHHPEDEFNTLRFMTPV